MKWILVLVWCMPFYGADEASDEELATTIEFDEFDLEDLCVARNNALIKFYNGTSHNLTELLEAETKTGRTLLTLIDTYKSHKSTNFSNPSLNRKLKAIFSPGSALLGENFPSYVKYAVGALEANSRPIIDGKNFSMEQVERILRTENNTSRLVQVWDEWAISLEAQSGKFESQLHKLTLEAEKSGYESAGDHWLRQSEITVLNYEATTKLWLSITPLYQKLRQFIAPAVSAKFGKSVFVDPKLIPVHTLGTLNSRDWVAAADRLEALKHSKSYSIMQKKLNEWKDKDLYKAADETTAELRLGYLPDIFFTSSQFEVESINCAHYIDTVCKTDREYSPRVLSCKDELISVSAYLRAHEEVARIKHLNMTSNSDMEGNENGYLFREGLSESVLYEAIATAASLLAIHPESLHRRGLLPSKNDDANMTFLLVSALHIIPAMPYYLAADLWRLALLTAPEEATTVAVDPTTVVTEETEPPIRKTINAETLLSLEEDEEEEEDNNNGEDANDERKKRSSQNIEEKTKQIINVTEEWWSLRAKLQGIGSPDGKFHADYLADRTILWNKPYISKFLGPILLFQILEHFKGGNTTENLNLLQQILRQGKSQPWESIVGNLFNITEIKPEPFLNYFKPLEAFLEGNANFNKRDDADQVFSENDFRKFLLGASAGGDTSPKEGKEIAAASQDSNALLVALTVLGVIGAVAVVISVGKNRLQKKNQAKRRRKLDLMS